MTKPVDPTPFQALQLEVPSSHTEAKLIALVILRKQKRKLMVIICYSPFLTSRLNAFLPVPPMPLPS